MNCIKCAAELSQGSASCWSCGTLQPESVQPVQQPHESLRLKTNHFRPQHPYRELGGWMQGIQIGLYVMMGLFFLLMVLNFVIGTNLLYTSLLFFTAAGTSLLTPWGKLVKRQPDVLTNLHRAWLWIGIIDVLWLAWMIYSMRVQGRPFTMAVVALLLVLVLVGGHILFAAARAYLLRSVRVRTYMGSDEYITQCRWTKHIIPPQPAVPDA